MSGVDEIADLELRQLMEDFLDADEAGDKEGYLNSLDEEQRNKLLDFLLREIDGVLREDLQ